MVAGYHLIWTAYGWWLPNDPRGSSSQEIRAANIEPLGDLHHGRKVIQPSRDELLRFFEASRQALKHELLAFRPDDFPVIANAFGETCQRRNYTCYACAVMPDHVHLLIRKHKDKAEEMMEYLRQDSRRTVLAAGLRKAEHPVWGGPGWKVFLETRDDFERVARYIARNPTQARLPAQDWAFVKRYDGWMPFVPRWIPASARNHK